MLVNKRPPSFSVFSPLCKLKCLSMFSLLFVHLFNPRLTNAASQVPCFFIFGDSLVDSGNNNNLATRAKANYEPYGIDFPQGIPTGRFTNGLTTADFLGMLFYLLT